MKSLGTIAAAILGGAVVITVCSSCGSSDSSNTGSSGSPAPATPAVVSTSIQGAQAASSVAQSRDFVVNTTEIFKRLGDIGLSKMTPSVPATATVVNCTDGGTYSYSGTYTAPRYVMTFGFNGCREGGYQYVGDFTLSGTPASLAVTLGGTSTFNIFNFDTGYTVLKAYLKANSSFTMTGAGTLPNNACTITSNGRVESFDYFLLNSYDMIFSRLQVDYARTTDPVSLDETTSITANGSFVEYWAARMSSATLKFTNFKVDRVKLNAATPPAVNYTSDDTSVNGRIQFTFRPATFGYNGIFDVVTQTPIHYVYAPAKHTTLGTLVINGTATAQYNGAGDITVSVAGDPTPLVYTEEYRLMKVSDFAAFEQDHPPLLGSTSSTPVTGASTLAVTLTWVGPSGTSASDMDTHVKYYSTTAPVGGTPQTWRLDYSTGKTCTDPVGIAFSTGYDLDSPGTGTCDVGLDFDDTNGYGPEHVTALKVPTGYYVIAVDSFSLHGDASATMYLSVAIGDNIFGPYSATLSTADGKGTTPSAWFRVADVRVNFNGSVDVLAPNLALNPWGP